MNISESASLAPLFDVRITSLRQSEYRDLMDRFENPIPHPCHLSVGSVWVSRRGLCPDHFCDSAWETIRPFVEQLASGGGYFFDGWMRNPFSALISCNDGFRPMSFLLERVE